jgi:hypothetical protein
MNDIRTMLMEERIPEGWESKVKSRFGLTIGAFQTTVLPVEIAARKAKVQ